MKKHPCPICGTKHDGGAMACARCLSSIRAKRGQRYKLFLVMLGEVNSWS